MNEEIKQMARDICLLPRTCENCEIPKINKGNCQARTYAERAYAKGWRKPTEAYQSLPKATDERR